MRFGIGDAWFAVFENHLAVNQMGDGAAAADDHLRPHPLFPVVGGRAGVQAVRRVQAPLVSHIGAGGAEVVRGSGAGAAQPAEELGFDGGGKRLVQRHLCGRLGVQHHSAVAFGPACAPCRLFADETVFHHQVIVIERLLPEQMTEAAIKTLVSVVADLQKPVFHPEGVTEILAGRVAGDFRRPAVQVFAVEEVDPVLFFRGLGTGRCAADGGAQKDACNTGGDARCLWRVHEVDDSASVGRMTAGFDLSDQVYCPASF